MHRFKELVVWQKSMVLTSEIYKLTPKLPAIERFGLRQQINNSAISIPSNIAEGAGRNSNKEFCHFLSISQGSAFELETQLLICQKLDYLKKDDVDSVINLLKEVQNMLFSFQSKLKKRNTLVTLLISLISF
jgi:four helix bundle protein